MPENKGKEKEQKMDRASLGVVVVYVCQMEGRPTIKEVSQVVRQKLQWDEVLKKEVKNAVLAAQKKGLLSVNYDDDMKERYSVRDVRWAKPPEIAHIKTLLPKLLATPEAKEIAKMFEGVEIDDKEHKKPRLPDIRDYVTYKVQYENLTPICGGEPTGAELLKLRRVNGSVWLPLGLWMRGALKIKLRMKNITVSKVNYLNIKDVFIPADKIQFGQANCPVSDGNGRAGTGISKHETLPVGTKFEAEIAFPTTGFMKEKDFVDCLDGIHLGAKHKEYGLMKLLSSTKIA